MATFQENIEKNNTINFDRVISAAAEAMPLDFRYSAKRRVSGGVRLLKADSELNDYLVAFGEIHRAKLLEFLPHIPFDKFYSTGLVVVDWGCGQALATAVLVDYLRSRNISVEIKALRLIELSEQALERAEYISKKYFSNTSCELRTYVWSKEGLEKISKNLPQGIPILHLFSNILDVKSVDLESVRIAVEEMRLGRESYVLSVGPEMETKWSDPHQLLDFFNAFDNSALVHFYPNQGCGRIYGKWEYWPYDYCKCYGFAYALSLITVNPAAKQSIAVTAPATSTALVSVKLPPLDPEDILMYASVGMVEEIETLINGGVDVNYRNEKGATALYFASKYGNEECVRMLLAAGADEKLAVRSTGFTPYLIAVKYERRKIILILKEAGCDTSVRDIRGRDAAAIVRVYNLNLKEDEI